MQSYNYTDAKPVTTDTCWQRGKFFHSHTDITVIDTPGYGEMSSIAENDRFNYMLSTLKKNHALINQFALVWSPTSDWSECKRDLLLGQLLTNYMHAFGNAVWSHTTIVVTKWEPFAKANNISRHEYRDMIDLYLQQKLNLNVDHIPIRFLDTFALENDANAKDNFVFDVAAFYRQSSGKYTLLYNTSRTRFVTSNPTELYNPCSSFLDNKSHLEVILIILGITLGSAVPLLLVGICLHSYLGLKCKVPCLKKKESIRPKITDTFLMTNLI